MKKRLQEERVESKLSEHMPVPDYQSLFLPVLQCVADGGEYPIAALRQRVAAALNLSSADLAERLPSGRQTVFANRIGWSTVYLMKAGALTRVKRGMIQIGARGRDLLALKQPRLTTKDLAHYPEFVAFHRGTSEPVESPSERIEKSETPEEELATAYRILHEALANELLETVRKSAPSFFEELVVDLLVAMGYGGSVEDAGRAVGKSGDGGIDGIIKEDKLGLDFVYVQAKRWSDSVGRPVVQAFAGSLEGFRARKGVLITTSTFSKEAHDYVGKIEKRIVLIDGKQLADLMIDYDIGVNVVQTYKIKRLDSDYFEDA